MAAPLKGLLFGPNGLAFTPTYTRRGKRDCIDITYPPG